MDTAKQREKEYDDRIFRWNAFYIIEEMVELDQPPSEHTTALVDEVLHSIFFLGKLRDPKFSPQDILGEDEDDMLTALSERYPRPFELYSSQLPRRSPFSCVLDMIVHLTGEMNEKDIIKKLQEIIIQMQEGTRVKNPLTSSTICVSQIPNSVRYYGVSMSTSGPNARQIIIAASCLSNWHSYVAGAVMTYYQENNTETYFDGTIKLPQQVRCQAFDLSTGEEKSPCKSCGNLFGLKIGKEGKEWPYGNCAEAESVSNLLEKDEKVREQARPTWTDENRQTAEESVKKKLRNVLCSIGWLNQKTKVKWDPKLGWDDHFYTPQLVKS